MEGTETNRSRVPQAIPEKFRMEHYCLHHPLSYPAEMVEKLKE